MRAVVIDPTQTFNRAVSSYNAGRFGDTEQLCQQILPAQPGHFDAAHVLAVVQAARGRHDLALASYDRAIAGRMLEHSQHIDNKTLLAAARTKGQEHLLAISRRKSIDESITDVLLERGDKTVVLSTASNPTARFSESGYSALVKRSTGDN